MLLSCLTQSMLLSTLANIQLRMRPELKSKQAEVLSRQDRGAMVNWREAGRGGSNSANFLPSSYSDEVSLF